MGMQIQLHDDDTVTVLDDGLVFAKYDSLADAATDLQRARQAARWNVRKLRRELEDAEEYFDAVTEASMEADRMLAK